MRKINLSHKMRPLAGAAFALLLLGAGSSALADPVVSTVPWVASNSLIPHDIFNGESTTLKGTVSDAAAGVLTYTWDFGDGSAVVSGPVLNQYVVEAAHTYTGVTGTIFTATLTVQNGTTLASDSKNYFVQVQDKTLESEVNVAIDKGLWRLHSTMNRTTVAGTSGTEDAGHWESGCTFNCSTWDTITPTSLLAFEVNGHLETGAAANPYAETVARGMRWIFTKLRTTAVSDQTYPAPIGGPKDPDGNGNGLGIETIEADDGYQGGTFMDAIIASGTPAAVTTTGAVGSIRGRTYLDIVQDMVDWYAFSQTNIGTYYGGWDYNGGANRSVSDNSTNQWAAIGLVAAEREFGIVLPQWLKDANKNSVNLTQNPSTGVFGYRNSTSPIWGPYAVTPSGMVQMSMTGTGRGDNHWDLAETYIRDNFCNSSTSAQSAIRSYFYGLFSFTKSMLLHDSNGDGIAESIDLLQSQTAGVSPIDWYAAQVTEGDQCDGVARTLVDKQVAAGYWTANNFSSVQYPFNTGWAIVMLNRTVFSSGLPVAVAQATPGTGIAGQTITLNGSASFHQDPAKTIDSWEWDLDNDGTFDAVGVEVTTSFPAVGSYPVTLRVTDDATPEADDTTVLTVLITTPPIAPTADADGPYVFCPQSQPWFLDGTASVNPDEGLSEPGQPGDTIQSYAWELSGDNAFDDAFGPQPDVTAFFTTAGTGDYLVQLKVTDTTATSFPSSNFGDLSDIDSTQVSVKDAADVACACIDNLAARPKSGKVQLTWTGTGADHYNVYRSTTAGGPYVFVASTTSTYSTYLDTGLTNGTTYYYVVREAALNGDELCQSNEVSATPVARVRRR